MGAQYAFMLPDSGGAAFAPTAGVANWVLECIASRQIRLIEFNWGGEVSSGNAMRTRIARDSAVGTGARTAIESDRRNLNSAAAPGFAFVSSTYATTQPTVSNAALWGTAWNSAGGQTVVMWQAAPGQGIQLVGAVSIECRQDIGTDGSTYGGCWEED